MSSASQIFRYSRSNEKTFSPKNVSLKIIIVVSALAWTSGIFIEHLIHLFHESVLLLPLLKKSYSAVCHQDPEKLLDIAGKSTMVCSRCAGIYFGFTLFSLSMFLKTGRVEVPPKISAAVAGLTLLDVLAVMFGILPYSKITAFITGFLLGSLGFLYFYGGLQNLLSEFITDGEN